MPRIEIYQPQVSPTGVYGGHSGGRAATAEDFGGGGFGANIGEKLSDAVMGIEKMMNDRAERDDKQNVRVMAQKARMDWTKNYIERQRSAAEDGSGFTEGLDKDLTEYTNKAAQGVKTRAGQELFSSMFSDLRADMVTKAMTTEAAMKGKFAKTQLETGLSNDEATLQMDPSQYKRVVQQQMDALDDPGSRISQSLSPEQRADLKRTFRERLALAAVQGQIRQDPTKARQELESGAWKGEINAERTQALYGQIRMEERARLHDATVARQEADRMDALEKDKVMNDWFTKIMNGQVSSMSAIVNDPRLAGKNGAQAKNWLVNIYEKQGDPRYIRTDPQTYTDLSKRVFDEKNPVDIAEINGAISAGRLSIQDGVYLRNQVLGLDRQGEKALTKEQRENEVAWKQYFKWNIEPHAKRDAYGVVDPEGAAYVYEQDKIFREKFDREIAAGKSAADLLDPRSKDFIGKPRVRTVQERVKSMAEGMGRAPGIANKDGSIPADKVRKDGETVDEWRKRTGQ